MSSAPETAQLSDVMQVVMKRWRTVAVIALIGALLGAIAFSLIPARYQASSTLAVNPMSTDPLTTSVDTTRAVNMPTEVGLITSREVASNAADELTPAIRISPSALQEAIKVETPQNSLILSIEVTADSAEKAVAEADAVAEAYLDARRDNAQEKVDRLIKATTTQLATVTKAAESPTVTPATKRPLNVRSDALAETLARLGTFDVDPGEVVSKAQEADHRSTPSLLQLGLAGLFLGLLIGIPVALLRKEDDVEIGTIDRLAVSSGQLSLDGTKDASRSDTWDIAAFMLKLPADLGPTTAYTVMVDADDNDQLVAPGEELVDALARRGRHAHFVDASAINEGKIRRGWPTERKVSSWAGKIIVIDTTLISSAANKVAIASRSDAVVLARNTSDDASALRRLVGLLTSQGVAVTLSCLFPSRQRSGGPEKVATPLRHVGPSGFNTSTAQLSRPRTISLLEPESSSKDPADD